ncbi:MAG TPA: hypothetical protein VEM95_07370 [Thermoplasmata archaeon]|nr:hypothetical protein [Thermoplasmata archaeon]
MRRALVALFLLLLLVRPAGAAPPGIGYPGWVNAILDRFQTPELAPGESGRLSFVFTNPYPWVMTNITLHLEIYRYREIDLDLAVNSQWQGPVFVDDSGNLRGTSIDPPVNASAAYDESFSIGFTVVTYPETRHGSIWSQGSYFVRTRLEFDLGSGATQNHSLMMSKGYFTDAQFNQARLPCLPANSTDTCPSAIYYEGLLNMTYLGSVLTPSVNHLDGLLPDTGFSVQDRLPLWPFLVVGGVMIASLVFSVLFYAEENPSKLPRLARWWLAVKGRTKSARRPRSK